MRNFLADFGLFLLRVTFGVIMFAHGMQNLFLKPTADGIAFYTKIGIPNPEIMFWVGNLTELIGGAALVIGILSRLAGLGTGIVMGGAIYYVHLAKGFWSQTGGYEYVLLLTVVGAAIFLTGPGRWSVDHLLFGRKKQKAEGAVTVNEAMMADAAAAGVAAPSAVSPAPVVPQAAQTPVVEQVPTRAGTAPYSTTPPATPNHINPAAGPNNTGTQGTTPTTL